MFTVKPLVRINSIRLNPKPLVRKNLAPLQERALIISAALSAGVSYQQAIRDYDKRKKREALANSSSK